MSDAQPNNLMAEAESIMEQLRARHGVRPPEPAKQPEPAEFFRLDGQYLIAPGTTIEDLMNDASCLLSSAIAVLDEGCQDLDARQYATLYLLKQSKALHDEAFKKMQMQRREEASHG